MGFEISLNLDFITKTGLQGPKRYERITLDNFIEKRMATELKPYSLLVKNHTHNSRIITIL